MSVSPLWCFFHAPNAPSSVASSSREERKCKSVYFLFVYLQEKGKKKKKFAHSSGASVVRAERCCGTGDTVAVHPLRIGKGDGVDRTRRCFAPTGEIISDCNAKGGWMGYGDWIIKFVSMRG
ncbi:hypothetical protein NPIL_156951 [Nephila pilipes]|uniref:Uncharacterized protein n=1 Tax=Nephila pilipes TaxID=299642 RepID=A0A8X6TNW6_NEPPI|nr:hypothetical protein NPIL_156951 [Nephila pilipes]